MEPGPWVPTRPGPLLERLPKSPPQPMALLEDEGAVLPVEGEVGDRDGAGGAEDGGRQPVDAAVGRHEHVAVEGHLEYAVHAAHRPGHVWMGPGDTNPSQPATPLPGLLLAWGPLLPQPPPRPPSPPSTRQAPSAQLLIAAALPNSLH